MSADNNTYRRSRVRAAELDTSVSAPVRGFPGPLARDRAEGAGKQEMEPERDRRHRLVNDVLESICATRSAFKAAGNIRRVALHGRDALR